MAEPTDKLREMGYEELLESYPLIYDIATDSRRPATQADVDEMQRALIEYSFKRAMMMTPTETPTTMAKYKFQLALYPNPMRPGEAFVAEAKEISEEPLETYHGRPLYAPVPQTEWIIRGSINLDFACEIVRRWNRPHGSM